MPVKKTSAGKKPSRKKSTTKKSTQIEKDIKAAVEKIPGLIYEKVEFTEPALSQLPKEEPPKIPVDYESVKRKRFYVWLSVIAVTLMIFAMWIWNTSIFFSAAKDGSKNLVNNLKKDWQKINQEKNSELEKLIPETLETNPSTKAPLGVSSGRTQGEENLDQVLKNSLTKILNNLATSTTGTLENASTTTLNAPNANSTVSTTISL